MNTNCQASQLLLLSASERRFELQTAISEALQMPVSVAATFADALSAVSLAPYRAVILDEGLADLDPASADQFLARCTDELPIFVKLAITGIPRCLQQVQLAMQRFDREQQIAVASAKHAVRSQVRDALTSILICGQLALKTPGMPPGAPPVLPARSCPTEARRAYRGIPPPAPRTPAWSKVRCRR